jgi:cyclic beta-1,2-glucan synthetase
LKVISKTIPGFLSHWWASLRGTDLEQKYASCELPLRSELFSSEQMKQHGRDLANSHQLGLGRGWPKMKKS